jgi:hypothetical protein
LLGIDLVRPLLTLGHLKDLLHIGKPLARPAPGAIAV